MRYPTFTQFLTGIAWLEAKQSQWGKHLPEPEDAMEGIRVWLDDRREMPPGYHLHVQTAPAAIGLLAELNVCHISLDNDLGPGAGEGYDVAKWIEEMAYNGILPRLDVTCHSDNSPAVKNIEAAIRNANRFWDERAKARR